ncbi:MAG: hypothetical protein KDA52_04415, partial [Planctomycetaceae bacterium]|nr:hypothetical protein [Planctomycetaceae bacterium]
SDDGSHWKNLFVVAVTNGTLTVELSDDANGYVIADAIRIEPTHDPVTLMPMIIDDGDAGFATTGSWAQPAAAVGRAGDLRHSAAGVGNDKSTWTFTGLVPGHYFIAATWLAHPNRASNAPFRIIDGSGGSELAARLVNQELAPDDFFEAGSDWEQIAHVTITGSELVVELSDDANQYVIADAIRIEPTDIPPPLAKVIIDNGDAGFSATAGWTPAALNVGHEGDLLHSATGSGSSVATWTFSGLTPGAYRVSATWFAHVNRATNAPFIIRNGIDGPVLATVLVNQELNPDDFSDAGSSWEDLMTISITGSNLVVELSDDADGYVIADAIRIEPLVI